MFAAILFVIVVSVVPSALSLLYVLLFFSGPPSGARSVSYPGLLGKCLNK